MNPISETTVRIHLEHGIDTRNPHHHHDPIAHMPDPWCPPTDYEPGFIRTIQSHRKHRLNPTLYTESTRQRFNTRVHLKSLFIFYFSLAPQYRNPILNPPPIPSRVIDNDARFGPSKTQLLVWWPFDDISCFNKKPAKIDMFRQFLIWQLHEHSLLIHDPQSHDELYPPQGCNPTSLNRLWPPFHQQFSHPINKIEPIPSIPHARHSTIIKPFQSPAETTAPYTIHSHIFYIFPPHLTATNSWQPHIPTNNHNHSSKPCTRTHTQRQHTQCPQTKSN